MSRAQLRVASKLMALVLVLGLSGFAEAQTDPDDYILHFNDEIGAAQGETALVVTMLDILTGATPVQGWSYGVCHDFTEVQPIAISNGITTSTVNNGVEADFISNAFQPGNTSLSGGVTQGVVISLFGSATLPTGSNYELLEITYDLLAPNGTLSPLDYCDDAELGLPAVQTVVVVNAASLPPVQENTLINIDIVPFELSLAAMPPTPQGETANTAVLLANSEPIYGFGFGVSHAAASLGVISVDQGTALAGFTNEFFAVSTTPAGGSGFTVGCVFSLDTNATLAPGAALELVTVEYQVLPSAPVGATPLAFTSSLRPSPASPPVIVAVSIGEESVSPITLGTSLIIEEGQTGEVFRRGDANASGAIDIADPVYLLDYLFSQGPTPTCLDSGDLQDNGAIDVSDPIYLIDYLFVSGPSPAAPFAACGTDPDLDGDGLSCLQSNPNCP